jgi:hypothetical protein
MKSLDLELEPRHIRDARPGRYVFVYEWKKDRIVRVKFVRFVLKCGWLNVFYQTKDGVLCSTNSKYLVNIPTRKLIRTFDDNVYVPCVFKSMLYYEIVRVRRYYEEYMVVYGESTKELITLNYYVHFSTRCSTDTCYGITEYSGFKPYSRGLEKVYKEQRKRRIKDRQRCLSSLSNVDWNNVDEHGFTEIFNWI